MEPAKPAKLVFVADFGPTRSVIRKAIKRIDICDLLISSGYIEQGGNFATHPFLDRPVSIQEFISCEMSGWQKANSV